MYYYGRVFQDLVQLIEFMNTAIGGNPIDRENIVDLEFDSTSGMYWIVYQGADEDED